jgi:putative nucleotidyltransferase with HDIG domain
MYDRLVEFVEDKCLANENLFQPIYFEKHIKQVEKFALNLAEILHADKEVVRVASLLHDISAICNFETVSNHATQGAIMACDILIDYPLSQEQKVKVFHCIEKHTFPIPVGADIPEAVCVSNAVAMALIAEPTFWMYYAFSVRKLNYTEGYQWYKDRVMKNWNALIHPASEIIYDNYMKTILLFEDSRKSRLLPLV